MKRKGSSPEREFRSGRHRSEEEWEVDPVVRSYDEELDLEPFRIGIATLAEISVDPLDYQASLDRLEGVTSKLADSGAVPFALGGEHSLTIAPVRALRERYPDLSVLQLDAHLDL